MESLELSPRTFREYREACDLLIDECGKQHLVSNLRPADFESLRARMTMRWGPARVGKFVKLIRTVSNYGKDDGLIEKPVLFGTSFKKPDKAVMRRHKAARQGTETGPTTLKR